MKKGLLFGIFMIVSVVLLAQENASAYDAGSAVAQHETHVTPAQALNVGYTFMRTGDGSKGNGTKSSNVSKQAMQLIYTGQAYDSLTGTVTDCYYVFALQPKGFVIVAADDRVEPILGYSYDNNFAVENMPDRVRGWLGNYEKQIQAVVKNNLQAEPASQAKWSRLKSGQSTGSRSGGSVGPLLTTTWNQGQYYNNLCPADANGPAGHVYTGCVATAMAQIIHYWGYPVHGRGAHSYYGNYGELTVNYANANYDYSLMPDALTSTSTTQEVDAVASLMRDCGVAVNMGYSPTESSSFDQDARTALINFYRFSPNLSFAEKAYFSDSEWNAMLHADLDNNRPVYYSGQGSGGHAFVCDGYNANGYYHFNFGWGGFADGWFLTSSITPGGSNFNDSQAAIFGIVPDSTGNVILGQTQGTSTFTVDEPLEFYHLMGHNAYEGGNYDNGCNNTIHFIPANSTNQIVADILDYEDQTLNFSDGDGNSLRSLVGGSDNDYSPVVSNHNALNIAYSGNMYYAGFKVSISQTDNNGCRMVSNITSFVEATTVHLTWTENGTATQWEIEYGIKGFALGTGTVHTADTNTATFSNLSKFTEYDFYIRPVCGIGLYGQRNKVTVMVEAEYWQDIVTSQPAGYVYNAQTKSVEISTAEGLAWWAKNVSGNYNNSKVYLTADIDLSGYKWRPVDLQINHIIFDGRGHRITHAFIRENADAAGLFNRFLAGGSVTIENLGLTNFYVKGSSSATGGLGGYVMGDCTIRNCYISNSTIDGTDLTGGLIGLIEGPIINCYANVNVVGNRWVGLMIGTNRSFIRNCYAAGTVRHRSSCYMAGITSYSLGDEISNCYSVETEMGVVGYKGSTIITDTSTFKQSNAGWDLLTPVVIDDVTETDLLSALNKGVKLYNDSVYCTWVADTGNVNGGYPVFGNKHVVQCPNETGFSVQKATVNNNYAVVVSWTENSNASQWRIRYRRHDMPDSAYTYVTATSNPDTIFGIPLGYSYDFNVRAICDANNRSGWSETQNLTVDLPYWTDIVTVQPAGYVEDANGNVEISSAEGLAWLSVITNGLHNQQQNLFSGKTVSLKSDIDLDGYRWYPICNANWWDGFSGTFDGQNHNISNIYINGAPGLFGVLLGSIKNVRLIGGNVINGSAGLIGMAMNCTEISNCHSSATIYSDGGAGSLCGEISNYGTSKIIVSNCSSSGTVYGREGCGNLIGTVAAYNGEIKIRNCYATGNVNSVVYRDEYAWYRGGLIGYVRGGLVENCFSTGSVEIKNYYPDHYGKVIGALDLNPHVHYIYGQDNVNEGWDLTGNLCEDYSNSSEFHHNGNTNALLDSVSISGTVYFDLLDALNAWVISQNDSTFRLWVLDSISGYPVFGDYYVPSCYNPTDLTVSQATVVGDPTIKTRLSWSQSGNPDHWEVLYVASGRSIDSGSVISVSSNPCVLAGIPIGHSLDFYVRSVCNEDDVSGWCGPVTYIPDKLHWTEVVTSQPEGYYEDANGNVYISSAEGLSWISSMTNELNGTQHGGFSDKQIFLTNDIDLSAYRWTAIGNTGCSFNGNNHIVSGLYCNELSDHQGLFSSADGEINNLLLSNCNVSGSLYVGGLAGAFSGKIVNCIVNGTVSGYQYAGGIVGSHSGSKIENSCFIGNVSNRQDLVVSGKPGGYSGGICGRTFNDTIVNCYVVCDFSDINHYISGILTGSGGEGSSVLNCYYKETVTDLPITRDNQANNSAFSGSGYTWTLHSPPYIGGSFHTDLLDALNTWVDAHNTNGQYHRWSSDTAMANGGYPIFESVSYPAVITQDTVLASGYYCWHGMVFTTNTTVTDTIPTINGYDSVITHHIIVTPALLTEIIVDTCNSYIWNSETYSKTGDYVQTFPSAGGIDSVVVLRLTINPLTGVDEYFICDDSYTWIDGVTYIASNHSATITLQTTDGCDSVTTLHLTVGHSSTWDTTVVTHTSFDWYEYTNLTQSGDYTRMLTNANGCDSVVTLHLTVITPPTVTTNTVSDITASSAFCGGNVTADGGAEVTERGVCWSTSQNPTIADSHIAIGMGTGAFTVNITGLAVDITYHVRAYATNSKGTAYGEEMTFTTTATPTPFTCGDGLIVGNNKYTTNEFGTQCWMTQNLRNADESYQFEYPDILQVCPTGWHLPDNNDWDTLGYYLPSSPVNFGDGDYWTTTTIPWSNGVTERTLIAPPYVQSNSVFKNTNFGCEIHDAAQGDCTGVLSRVFVRCLRGDDISATLPSVTTDSVINITATTATCGGNVTSDGGAEVTERGVCWNTSHNPTIADSHTSDGTGTGAFTSQLTSLEANTTYHVRAYATNSEGTAYGEEVTFTTETAGPTPQTYSCGDNLIVGGNIYTTHQYGSQCWMTRNLRNASGGEQFDYPDVLQACPTGWHLPDDSEWYTLGSNLPSSPVNFDDGNYWTSTFMPWQDADHNQFTLISPPYVQSNNVTYTVSACEIHDAAQCDCIIHTCLSVRCIRDENVSATLPTVTTDTVINITASSATCVGDVLADGGSDVTERGICWNALQDSTVSVSIMGAGTGAFAVNLSDLTPNTTYHVRAFATNSAGTAYGEEVTFTTTDDSTPTTITCGYQLVVGSGSYTTYQYGTKCWMTQNLRNPGGNYFFDYPDVLQACPIGWHLPDDSEWSTLGIFLPTSSVNFGDGDYWTSTFIPWQDYVGNQFTLISPPYVNSNSVSFSGGACEVHDAAQGNCQVHTELSVRCIRDDTTATPPTVSTVTVIDITATTATSGGNVIADGGATVTERGVCWSTSANPTVANSHTSDGTGTGVFTSQLIGLEPSTTYHVRAYSTNRIGTTYGEEVTFTTGCPPVDVTITSDKAAICEGECTTLHASGADSYIWSTGENISTITVCPTITTTYSVTGFDLYGCESAASFTLMVNDLPATPFVTVDNASVCDGGEVSLSISNLDSNPSTSYTWSRNGIVIPGTTQAIMVDNPTAVGGETTNYAYTVMASHSNSGCVSGISEPTVVTVNVMNNTELFETACNSYEWNDSVYTQSGNYTQTFTNDNGCDSIVTLHLTVNYTTTTTVTTGTVNDITPYSAICGGNVIADGCAEVTERGVCWSTSQNPTVADSHTSDSIGVGTFSSQLIGLEPNTTYYMRAYATNSVGTAYGEELMFTTASQFTCGENLVVNYYSYTTMNYGSQCWMTQNLRNASGSEQFDYPDVLQACPTGWHLPDNNDWNTLGVYLPSSSVYFGNGDYWTSTLIPYQTYQGEQFTLISPPYVNSNSVSFSSGTACEVHDAAQGNCQVHTELSVRCLRNENAYASLPTVTTQAVSNIMPNTAICGGIVTADGGATVTARGVCWSVSENPTIADSHTINGGGAGAFTSQLTDLELNITYHVRAYATNSAGTAYGEDVTFTTDLCGTLSISISGEDGISHICESEPVTLIANVEADGFTPENLHYTWYEDGQVRDNMTFGLGDTNVYAEYWASRNSIYTFFVEVTYGTHLSCVAQSEERYVRVYSQPATPVVTVDQTTIYDGGQVVLSATSSDLYNISYTWYKNGEVIPGATGANIVDNPTTVGGETTHYVYTVEASNLYTGCTSEPSEPTVVTVRVTPTATVTAEGDTVLCEGDSTTLHVNVTPANYSYCYQWYEDGMLIPGATSADYVVSKHARYTAYNFTVRVSASGGLDILVPGPVITVMPAPFVTALASEISICEGGTSTLTAWVAGSSANYGYNFQWFRSIPHPDGTSDTNLVGTNASYTTSSNVPVNSYTYWVEVTSEYGCSSQSNQLTLTVKPNPSVTISGNTTFCEGGYTTLYANVTPDQDASYVWYKDGAEMFFSMPSIPVTDGGVYTVAATVYGCSSQSDPITLTVKPNPSVFISGGTTFCEGGSTTLYANVTPDQDATYVWYKNGAEMALYTPSITVTDGGTYTVEATANGCSDLAGYVTVTVEENPQLQLSATETNICIGGHTTITANAVNWSDGNIFYSWSDSYGSSSSYDFSFEQAGLHTITVTATNTASGCQGTNSITINVNDLPETPVVTVNQATVFDGGQVTLSVTNPIPNAIYTWYKNGELIPFTNQSSHTEYLMTIDGETTIYTYAVVAALDISGCVSAVSDNTEVTVFPTPVANVTVNGLTIFCEGSSTTLHVDVTPLNGPTYAYQWYKDGVLIPGATSADYVVAEPARTTSYNFHVVVSANGSYNVTAYAPAVTVVSSPTVVATISENTVCVGGTATLTAMVSGGIGGLNGLNNYSYQWFRNADSTTELVGTNYTYTTAGDEPAGTYAYWLAISNGYGCNSQSESVMFTVVDDPTVTITPAAGYNETVCNGGSTVLQANATGGFGEFSYQWYKNGFLLIGETNQTLAINDLYYGVNYTYTVSVTQSGASCATISAPQAVIVNALSYTTLFETACEDYTWNGVTYAQTGEYTQTFTGANGCDSVVTLYLIVNHANTGDTTAVANDMFDWYEHTYLTQSGDYTHVFTNQNGCDSVVTLHLTVNNPTISVQDTVMTAGYFIWHGIVFTSDTVLFEMIPVFGGYDSLVIYHVFVTPTPLTVLNVDTCVSYTLNGQTYTETGDYVQTFPVSGGMDSVVVLYLTIFPADSADFTETACESFTWEGTTYTTSGDYTKTLTNANGCDSVVTLHLTLFPADSTDFAETACEVFTWDGTTYTTSGDYTKTFSNVNGCDSTVTLHLTIFPADSADFAETACESFTWNGTTYTSSGDYTQTFTNANGCDSTVTLHLTVNFPDNSEYSETACDSYTWEGTTYTQSGDYTQTFTNANGCDSIVTLHLTVNHGTHNIETETACESYEWHGATYTTSGTYTYEYNNADGCASVDTLHLTINFAQSAEFAVTTADSCYSWNGHLYCESGDYTQTLTAANGCDSTVTLHLTITVGIDDHNLGASMTVYPNPTNGIVNVQCTMNNVQVGTMEYHVFDAYGKLVDVVGMNANGSSEQTAHIDLSGFANGVYFVKAVADGNVVAVRKVVKR